MTDDSDKAGQVQSELSAGGKQRDVEITPKCTRPNYILARRSSLGPSDYDDNCNKGWWWQGRGSSAQYEDTAWSLLSTGVWSSDTIMMIFHLIQLIMDQPRASTASRLWKLKPTLKKIWWMLRVWIRSLWDFRPPYIGLGSLSSHPHQVFIIITIIITKKISRLQSLNKKLWTDNHKL